MTENDTSTNGIEYQRFYLCDVGESEDAFLVCGRCLERYGYDPMLYDQLPPLPEAALKKGYTRVCFDCDRDAEEIRAVDTDTDRTESYIIRGRYYTEKNE